MKRKRIAIIIVGAGLLSLLTLAALRGLEPSHGERKARLTGARVESLPPSNPAAASVNASDRVPGTNEGPRNFSPTGVSGPPAPEAPGSPEALLERQRSLILSSRYGTAPIRDVLRELSEATGGPEVQLIFQALALRKNEALPVVRERLRAGAMYEKHLLTKFLRLCPWPETRPELLALAGESGAQWLPRQGALYALGALGDVSVGPEVVAILRDPACPEGVKLVSIAALARIGYREGAAAIRPYTEGPDLHLRLFAWRALAELGEPVNRDFLFSALQNEEHLIRQEACEALAAAGGAGISGRLQAMAKNDPHEAVRDAAAQALLQQEIRDLAPAQKLALLGRKLEGAERHNALWIVQTILAQCGKEGRAFVGTLASGNSRLGERASALLILSANTL